MVPALVVVLGIHGFTHVLAAAPSHAIVYACLLGFAWGFGRIMFGQGVAAIGISMANTLSLTISASFGSILPILVLDPRRLYLPQGKAIILGTFIGLIGIVCFGYAGFRKEKSQKDNAKEVRGNMVGYARTFRIGLLLCAGSGLLSAVFNIGYSLAQPIRLTAMQMGHSAFAGTCMIWMLLLMCGFLPSVFFCSYLLTKNKTWHKFVAPG